MWQIFLKVTHLSEQSSLMCRYTVVMSHQFASVAIMQVNMVTIHLMHFTALEISFSLDLFLNANAKSI